MRTSRDSQTFQTHNAVSVPGSNGVLDSTTWIDCKGYDQIAVTFLNDASTSATISVIWSNDGAAKHGDDVIIATGTSSRRAGRTGVKARYCKVSLLNADAAAHTMSAWAYLIT